MTFIEQNSPSGKTQQPIKLLKSCPFCGANPHHGLGKVEYCQLHGEPFQQFRIWCPHGCAEKSHPNREWAIQDWNKRPDATGKDAEIERLREALKPLADLLDAAELMGGPSRLRNDDDILYQTTSSKVGDRRITLGDMKRARAALAKLGEVAS